jgi:hypothetical protein
LVALRERLLAAQVLGNWPPCRVVADADEIPGPYLPVPEGAISAH